MTKIEFIEIFKTRFSKHPHRHPRTKIEEIIVLFERHPELLASLMMMEMSGGEVDLVEIDGVRYFIDMFSEAPKARVNVCYDQSARLHRKKFPPISSALEEVGKMGTELLSEDLYHQVQMIEDLDLKTSSWLLTPPYLRTKGGALFGDKRYGRTFVYQNGADSYYSVRGYRSYLKLPH